ARLWSLTGILVFAAVTLVWLAHFLASGSQSFGESVVWEDWLAWYLAWPAPRRIFAFLGDAFVGFLPWTLLLILAVGPAIRARRAIPRSAWRCWRSAFPCSWSSCRGRDWCATCSRSTRLPRSSSHGGLTREAPSGRCWGA